MEFDQEILLPLAISTQFTDKYNDENFTLAGNESTIEAYWSEQAKVIDWYREPDIILDKSNAPFYTWFKGGVLNTSYNCIDRHVKKDPSRKALIYENSFGFPSIEYTYSELLDNVSRLAGVLCDHGIKKGDVVMICMPNIPEAMFSIFACARIGAIHYTVYAGLGVDTLTELIKTSNPKLILLSSFTMASNKTVDLKILLDLALKKTKAGGVKKIIVQRESYKVELIKGEDYDFYNELAQAKPKEAVPLNSTHPLLLLNTSGTTGVPKGLLYENASWLMGSYCTITKVMKVPEGGVYLSNSGLAWIGGMFAHAYGCLFIGGTSIIFEGNLVETPELPFNLCEKHRVTNWNAFPSAIRTLKKMNPEGNIFEKYDLSALQCIPYGGERMDTVTKQWLKKKVPRACLLVDGYGQTESGMLFASSHKPLPGVRFVILDDNDKPVSINKSGRVCIKLPMPPGFAVALNNSPDLFYKKYLAQTPGYYTTGDMGYLDENGELYITGRADDVIVSMARNVGASQVEDIIIQHPDVAEVAVAGGPDSIADEIPYAFIVLKKDVKREIKEIENECVEKAIADIGSWFSYFTTCIAVDELPKSRSGKLLRRVLKNILYGEEVQTPDTMINPHVLDGIKKQVKEYGIQAEAETKIDESIV